jgi:hypothetical protein
MDIDESCDHMLDHLRWCFFLVSFVGLPMLKRRIQASSVCGQIGAAVHVATTSYNAALQDHEPEHAHEHSLVDKRCAPQSFSKQVIFGVRERTAFDNRDTAKGNDRAQSI